MSDNRQTVLITGCNPGGIGNSLAREFHAKGLRVFATARRAEALSDLSAIGVEALSLEVTDHNSIEALKKEVEARTGGKLDYLVNNAGRNYTVPALDMDFDEVRLTFEVNLFGVMRMVQAFSPLLIAAKGTIVQIGSVAALFPFVFGSAYNASKAALHSYSNTLRVELEPFGVKVITVITGGVKSRIARTERHLPQGSIYIPLDDQYQKRLVRSQEGGMPNEAYARSVVSKVLTPWWKRLYIWEGNAAWTVWFVSSFLPQMTMDIVVKRMFQLWRLARSRP